MINTEGNPNFLNSFLDYTATILNKSPNTIKEYNYDLNNFLKFILVHFKMTDKKDYKLTASESTIMSEFVEKFMEQKKNRKN